MMFIFNCWTAYLCLVYSHYSFYYYCYYSNCCYYYYMINIIIFFFPILSSSYKRCIINFFSSLFKLLFHFILKLKPSLYTLFLTFKYKMQWNFVLIKCISFFWIASWCILFVIIYETTYFFNYFLVDINCLKVISFEMRRMIFHLIFLFDVFYIYFLDNK